MPHTDVPPRPDRAAGTAMTSPMAELRDFLHAALVRPVETEPPEAPGRLRRRRIVSGLTYVAGTITLALTLNIAPGDPAFYPAALGLAGIWAAGAFLAGPLRAGNAHTRAGGVARPIIQPIALGLLLLGVFLGAALVVARIPWLRAPVEELLLHARVGALGVVLALTVLNGIVEELYFRGALYASLPPRYAVAGTSVLYTVTTIGTGVPLLVLAALLLGLVTGLQRRVTGGVLAPILTHITWSSGMLLLLPAVLQTTR